MLQQLDRVLVVVPEAVEALEAFRQARMLGGDVRRALLVVPEPRCRELALELGERAAIASGSKVTTGPVELGSDLLELLLERDVGSVTRGR